MECFICCTKSGKSREERLFDNIYHKGIRYPIIPLCYAYDCRCSGTFAHNKCLLTINKCPTCRKLVTKPRLVVRKAFESYVNLQWIYNNPLTFQYFTCFNMGVMTMIFLFVFLNEQKVITIENNYVLFGLVMIQLLTGVILTLNDYTYKYWLYDKKSNTFY